MNAFKVHHKGKDQGNLKDVEKKTLLLDFHSQKVEMLRSARAKVSSNF
jgi:hypothetical protein